MTYSKAEKVLIDVAHDYFIENGPGTVSERVKAKIPRYIGFYHDVGLINDEPGHVLYWSILKKAEGGDEVITAEEVSKAKVKAEKIHLKKLKEEADIRASEALEAESKRLHIEAEAKKTAAADARKAKLEALEAEKERLIAEADEIEGM